MRLSRRTFNQHLRIQNGKLTGKLRAAISPHPAGFVPLPGVCGCRPLQDCPLRDRRLPSPPHTHHPTVGRASRPDRIAP